MGKAFGVLRSIVFVIIFAVVLAFVPIVFYQGDFVTSLFLSIGMFVASVLIAYVLLLLFKRD